MNYFEMHSLFHSMAATIAAISHHCSLQNLGPCSFWLSAPSLRLLQPAGLARLAGNVWIWLEPASVPQGLCPRHLHKCLQTKYLLIEGSLGPMKEKQA